MTEIEYRPRHDGEPLAQYLHAFADLFGADETQRAILSRAAAMSYPQRSAADRGEAGRMAHAVQVQLKNAIHRQILEAQGRGETVRPYNDAGAMVVLERDGLYALARNQQMTDARINTALQLRALWGQVAGAEIGSQLGALTGQPSAQRTSVASLHAGRIRKVYASYQLEQAERAMSPDALPIVRAVVCEGQMLTRRGMSGGLRRRRLSLLIAALDAARISLAETGGLRIRGT